jgi:eukaryotic-like serine/threonine-protein kinase
MSSGTSDPAATAVLRAGDTIAGKYRVDGVLAVGGMGVVYRGWHLTLEVPIAVKVMRSELATRPDSAMRFLNEARSAARMGGQHVARVLDIGAFGTSVGGALYMVMELLEGCDLRAIIDREGHLPPDRAIKYVLGACDALAEVHAAGIVHRDVKPDNLFLARGSGETETVKLLDFGISKSTRGDRGYETLEGLGSPLYVAPEQLTRAAQVDGRADIWSLGVVLYELLSGRVPFGGESIGSICAAVMAGKPEPLRRSCRDVSPALEAIVLRCLSKRPEARFPTVHDLSMALRSLQCARAEISGPVSVSRWGPTEPGPRHTVHPPAPTNVPRRQDRGRSRPARNWTPRMALSLVAAVVASGNPLSTLLDAVAARGSAHPATVQAAAASRSVEPPPAASSGPVVCPVLREGSSEVTTSAARRDGPSSRAAQAQRPSIARGQQGVVRRDNPGSRARIPTRSSPPDGATPWPPTHALIPLMPPYDSEPNPSAETNPYEVPDEHVLGFAELEPGGLMRPYGRPDR